MSLILLVAAIICELVATILGFHWFGTDGADWAGWISAGILLCFLSLLAGGVAWPAPLRRT
jgi:hypothetical protein